MRSIFIILFICTASVSIASSNKSDKTVSSVITINWDAVTVDTSNQTESGTIYYTIYGDSIPSFTPGEENVLGATQETSFSHTTIGMSECYYLITATDEYGNTSEFSRLQGTAPFVLSELNVLLQGPFDVSGDSMITLLGQQGFIPLLSPYQESPRAVTEMPADIVDWVLVLLRDPSTHSPLASRSLLLRKDGKIVEIDGSNATLGFTNLAAGDYEIVIKHRNHLGIMASQVIGFSQDNIAHYDFTDAQEKSYQDGSVFLKENAYGLISGDANGNGQVQVDDKNIDWREQVGRAGYWQADFNLNGQVQVDDKNIYWRNNVGKGTQTP
ncbi:hypothetical protein GF406_22315 [candidate division KSB1 bacterium]|nr:hypothetical protein [candidate division KSB1 bacterium]